MANHHTTKRSSIVNGWLVMGDDQQLGEYTKNNSPILGELLNRLWLMVIHLCFWSLKWMFLLMWIKFNHYIFEFLLIKVSDSQKPWGWSRCRLMVRGFVTCASHWSQVTSAFWLLLRLALVQLARAVPWFARGKLISRGVVNRDFLFFFLDCTIRRKACLYFLPRMFICNFGLWSPSFESQ